MNAIELAREALTADGNTPEIYNLLEWCADRLALVADGRAHDLGPVSSQTEIIEWLRTKGKLAREALSALDTLPPSGEGMETTAEQREMWIRYMDHVSPVTPYPEWTLKLIRDFDRQSARIKADAATIAALTARVGELETSEGHLRDYIEVTDVALATARQEGFEECRGKAMAIIKNSPEAPTWTEHEVGERIIHALRALTPGGDND